MMSYRIERRDLNYFVIDNVTGLERGPFSIRTEAEQAINDIQRSPPEIPSAESAEGKSRSSIYREADRAGTFLNILKRVFPRLGETLRNTEHHYFRLDIWNGMNSATVEKHYRDSTSRLKRAAASMKGNTAKQQTADKRAAIATAMEADGKTQKEIAAALGLKSTRGVRKLLNRGK